MSIVSKQLVRDYKKLYQAWADGRMTELAYNKELRRLRKKHNTAKVIVMMNK